MPGTHGHSLPPVPRYLEIAHDLKSTIESGTSEPGHRLPAERILAERYGSNRQTIRQALDVLRQEGLISTEKRGSFVRGDRPGEAHARLLQAPPEAQFPLGALSPRAGIAAATRLVWEAPPALYATKLGLRSGVRTLVHYYTASAGDRVIQHAVSYLSPSLIAQIPLLARYERTLSHHTHSDLRRLYAWAADAGLSLEHNEQLTMAPGDDRSDGVPQLEIHREVRDQHHRTVEITLLTFPHAEQGPIYHFTSPARDVRPPL
ncbi:GntR family transcriptional regulator [Streptomyces sp. YS-3]|uniref:GntR family transcriptional regulator n=1 Tax=Streptomyces sp. YS-3 TaxID=3381352 RepID=UPI003862909B